MEQVKLIECPRDAWQGLPRVMPTEEKVHYLARLISLGFRHIDAVSFVSPKHVPQMADSEQVVQALYHGWLHPRGEPVGVAEWAPRVEIIAIVVNEKGLDRALATPGVTTIGYPHSISEQFARSNANVSVEESRALVERLHQRIAAVGRQFVVYISMAFGNPYGEPWSPGAVAEALAWLRALGVRAVSLADTVGTADARSVGTLYREVRNAAAGMELGVHLHSRPEGAADKVLAAFEAGCRRFDSALGGLGGCPFAGDELVGNIPTEIVVSALHERSISAGLEPYALSTMLDLAESIRTRYG